MNIKRALLPVLALTAWSAAADPTSLADARREAEQLSPQLQRAAAARDEAHWKRVEANSTWYPTLGGSANYLLDKKYMFLDVALAGSPTKISIPQIIPTTTFGLDAKYNLFDGFASTNREHSAQRFESAAEDEYRWARFELDRQIALQYYRALAMKSLKAVAESNLNTLKDHLSDTKAMRASGLSTNYDVLRVEVQVSESESEFLNATDNIELAAGRLAEVIGTQAAVDPVGALPDLKPDLINGIAAEPSTGRADLAALTHRSEALDFQERAAANHWAPTLAATGTYNYYNNRNDGFDDWGNFRNAYTIGLALQWNFFDGFRSTSRDHQAVAQRVQSEKIRQSTLLKARQDLNLWTRKFRYNCLVYKSRQNDVAKATESVRLAREGRRVGARTNTDLLDAEGELYRAQAGAINAQLGAVEALINVELALGQPVHELQ